MVPAVVRVKLCAPLRMKEFAPIVKVLGRVTVPVAVKDEKVAVPANAGEVEKTTLLVPVSSDNEFAKKSDVAVVVALLDASKKSARDAVNPERVVVAESVALESDGAVRVLLVSVCVPPTVTTDAALVPAVVTRRSPPPLPATVRTPALWVSVASPAFQLMTPAEARNRFENAVPDAPREPLPFEDANTDGVVIEVVKVGAVPNTATPVPVSSVRELSIVAESAVVVALLCASVNSARDAV